MTKTELELYTDELKMRGSRMDLSGIEALLMQLGNPDRGGRYVHIAGTNGKGSVLAMTRTMLKKAGYRVGSFSSPGFYNDRDSICINENPISLRDFNEYLEKIKQTEDETGITATWFEVLTSIAFLYFRDKRCDVVVLECGMGGRDDATNVIEHPLVCVLTSISHDHEQMLGETLEKIAEVKCGIIANDTVVITAEQAPTVDKVIDEVCRVQLAERVLLKKIKLKNAGKPAKRDPKLKFDYGEYKDLELNLIGSYQIENAAIALETVGVLNDRYGFDIPEKAIRAGLQVVNWPGRFERISKKPLIYIDGAHNKAGAKALRESIMRDLADKKLYFIVGVLKDKDYEAIVRNTCDLAKAVFTFKPNNPRGLPSHELAKTVLKYNKKVTETDSMEEAIELAGMFCKEDGAIVAFGSLSFLGAFKNHFEKRR